jgi:hypothetical protein
MKLKTLLTVRCILPAFLVVGCATDQSRHAVTPASRDRGSESITTSSPARCAAFWANVPATDADLEVFRHIVANTNTMFGAKVTHNMGDRQPVVAAPVLPGIQRPPLVTISVYVTYPLYSDETLRLQSLLLGAVSAAPGFGTGIAVIAIEQTNTPTYVTIQCYQDDRATVQYFTPDATNAFSDCMGMRCKGLTQFVMSLIEAPLHNYGLGQGSQPKHALKPPPTHEYVVQKGDTLSSIAFRHRQTDNLTEIIKRNGIKDPNHISVGQRIRIRDRE